MELMVERCPHGRRVLCQPPDETRRFTEGLSGAIVFCSDRATPTGATRQRCGRSSARRSSTLIAQLLGGEALAKETSNSGKNPVLSVVRLLQTVRLPTADSAVFE